MSKEKKPNQIPDRWPQGAIVYHIYPRSLQDSNGDGIGDIPGIISRLDYIKSLEVTVIWLSPFYPSPMADFGYDVSDYCAVHPIFGKMADFDRLLTEAHHRNLKVMIDLVPNHTSDEHSWFKQSRSSRTNRYADWYVWRDPKPGSTEDSVNGPQPPNNWRDALTGGSAWQWDETRQQFYLHSFDVRQPDLNWSNPAVRRAMQDVMRFWLDKGVDGFRVDAVYWMGKEPLMSDDTPNPDYVEGEDLLYDAVLHDNSRGWPAVYAYLNDMASVLKEPQYADALRFMVTEAYPERHNPLAAYLNFYASVDPAVAAPFNFEGVTLPWEASAWRKFLRSFHRAIEQFNTDCVPSYAFGNHDQPRLINRLGSEEAARSAAVLLLTLPGMAFIYYGEEVGMHDVPIPPEYVQDPAAQGDPRGGIGRDPERTPMQWNSDKNAGFSTAGRTWLPVAGDYTERNVETESSDPHSFLSLYRFLARLRMQSHAIKYGSIEVLELAQRNLLGYVRRTGDEAYLVLINYAREPTESLIDIGRAKLLVSSAAASPLQHVDLHHKPYERLVLAPHEAAVFRLPAEWR